MKSLQEIRVDRAFLGTLGVTTRWEASNSDLDRAALQRHILSGARESYLLVDHTKFGRAGVAIVAPLRAFTAVITDRRIAPNLRAQLEKHARKAAIAG